MQFQPKTEQEINKEKAAQGVWPVGEYPFEILDRASIGNNGREIITCERTSKSGNPMFQIAVSVQHPSGTARVIPDYILPEFTKFYDLCKACGIVDKYNEGKVFDADLIGKKGKVKLGIERDENGQYPDKNKITDYVIDESLTQQAAQSTEIQDDEIPY